MASTSPASPRQDPVSASVFGKTRIIVLLSLVAPLVVCVIFAWTTRDAMAHLSFLRRSGAKATTLVDLRPWQTIQALAPLAVTTEEADFAHEALRLADHEVDQAFASALRQANLEARHRTLSGHARDLAEDVSRLEDLIKQDQAQIDAFTAAKRDAGPANALEMAKAQLGLDQDELADAQQDLARAAGDNSAQIQSELAAHQAATKPYEAALQSASQPAVVTERRRGTLAARLRGWFSQSERLGLLQQAIAETNATIEKLTAEHNALETKANAGGNGRPSSLGDLKDRSAERQILSIYDDRIETEQQLAQVYGKWAAQVELQHRIVFHLILQSVINLLLIGLGMVLVDALVRRLLAHPKLDSRQAHTLRSIVLLAVQCGGAVLILLVVFGAPHQTSTMLGLATAALTIALQDFILAFLGWFLLMGKHGIHVGDWVEINGVAGEVTEVGLFSTALLETGNLTEVGQLTGRRIRFLNSYAIRGQYFNFSTAGQWMWDEITVTLPAGGDLRATSERIQQAVTEETEANARLAERDWQAGTKGASLRPFHAEAALSLRPNASGIEAHIRYVTRAGERVEMRDRLSRRLIELLHAN